MLRAFGHNVAMCSDMLRHVGCCWLKFENDQIWANNTQHVAPHRNTVAKRMKHVAPNRLPTMLRFVVLACCDRLAGALPFLSSMFISHDS